MMYGHGYNGMHDSYDVYLAGPFFNTQQKMVMAGAKMILEEAGLTVCDPQDLSPVIVDMTEAERKAPHIFETIYKNNIEGMRRSWALFACIDDRDTGTAFELGWFVHDMAMTKSGFVATLSGHGHGCNVMLSQAVDAHYETLDKMRVGVAFDVGRLIKERRRGGLLEAVGSAKAVSEQ